MTRRRSLLALVIAGALLWASAPSRAQVSPAAKATASITFAHFNDVYEIDAVENGASGGLARLATALDRLRRTSGPVVTTLGGDFLSPSALGTAVVAGEPLAGRQMVDVLNTIGLQWATLGNHEFDLSEAAFHKRLAEAKFKIVVSNATDASGQQFANTAPLAIVSASAHGRTVRIGLIGLVIDSTKKPWVKYTPPIDAARAQVAALKGKVDAIVALTHLALLQDQALLEALPEIDLVLGGHEHENWSIRRGPHFSPIVKADANVRSLAVVTMKFAGRARPEISARFDVLDSRVPMQARTQMLVKKWVDTAFDAFRRDGFDPAAVVANIPEALDGRELTVRNRPGNLTALVAEAMRSAASADAAVLNGGSIRIDDQLPPGPIRQYDIIRILPFGGKVLKVTLDGILLRQILEAGEANIGSGGFLQLAGITGTNGAWTVNGRQLDAPATFTVAMPEFLLTGLESRMAFLTRDKVRSVEELRDIRLILIEELRRRFPGKTGLRDVSGGLRHSLERIAGLAR
jgi:5'-nucleotidase / UDP-sugar diphosphatase